MIIDLHDNDWLEKQRYAGKVVAKTLALLENLVKEKTIKSLLELDQIAEEFILKNNCIPTFKNYKKFPNSVCISVNLTLVHGISDKRKLCEGDVVSFDLGATFEGVIADAARTIVFGEYLNEQHEKLVRTTKECLQKAIDNIQVGKRLGCIGETIYKHARNNNFSVITNYGGHSISKKDDIGIPHAPPFVANKANANEGVRFCEGMVLAIEPLLVIENSTKTRTLDDGWTVVCENICAHYEDTVYIHQDKVEVITKL